MPNSGLFRSERTEKSEKRDKYLDLARKLKKKKKKKEKKNPLKDESDGDTKCNLCTGYSHQRIGTGIGGLGNNRTREDHPVYSIIKTGQNTEKSHGDLKRLVVT